MKIFITILISGILIAGGLYAGSRLLIPQRSAVVQSAASDLRTGDIIFQTSLSAQSKAIQLATHSAYSHCGIIYKTGNDYYVYEAIEPVKFTPLKKWIARGMDGKYVIKRLKNADKVLTTSVLQKMKEVAAGFRNKHYDLYFEWSNDRIYCSELVWKIYKEAAGVEVGRLEKLKDFDLTSEPVKQKMKERYGSNINLDEVVISPASIYNCDLLRTVRSN
ncbi:MAG: YiiX family permuted papain-like enzyme [Chitinophagaceae bacterium]